MELLELHQIADFMRLDGHSYLQTLFLIMIWWTTRGLKKAMSDLQLDTNTRLEFNLKKTKDHESRIYVLEQKIN